MEWDDENPLCTECRGILCEHGNCEMDCNMNCDCDCFIWDVTTMDIIRQQLDDAEPTHATK